MDKKSFFQFMEALERENNIVLPIFLKYATEVQGEKKEIAESSKLTKSDFYSTSEKLCHAFCKPISKIVTNHKKIVRKT
jgi:hypothetical protein